MQENQEAAVNPLERQLEMSVVLADIEQDVQQRLSRLARQVKMPGFRPGKVPLKLVAQQYGVQVRSEALGEAVQRAFGQAVVEQKLRIAGTPRIEPRQSEDSSRLEFRAVFEVYPEVQIGDLSTSPIERPVYELADADVDKTIDVLRKQRTTYEAADRAAAEGDRIQINFVGRRDGEPFPGGSGNDYPVTIGAKAMLPDFEAALTGMSAGETKTFDLTFPADYHSQDLAGQQVSFEVSVLAVEAAKLPELDADFARALGIADGDLAKLREEVKTNLGREIKKRVQARVKQQAMDALLAVTPLTVPKSLVEEESKLLADNMRKDMQGRGMDMDKLPIEPAWFGEAALRRVKLGLIIAEVLKNNQDLHAQPEQIRALVQEQAQSFEQPEELVRWYYAERQRLGPIEAVVLEDNVVEWVTRHAQTVDKAIGFDELMANAA
ncbi:MAG: trigger factor [Rhodocyclaceae bacterium]|nr:trigger factor [Rhodocyclaceae bacterium]MBX3670889.1 trigger factor [Rhodocyclaceae bacterium]